MKKTILQFCISLFAVGTFAQTGNPFKWPTYSPNVRYNFKEQNPNFVEPTKNLNDCIQVVGEVNDRWFTFRWGPNKRSTITELAIKNLLIRMNDDFAYFRDVMGWPSDKRARNGYRSTIYLYGSGLTCSDNADSNALGGWQSNIRYQNQNWPMVLASYVPIQSFDPQYNDEFQKGAMVHEGIHAVLADMPGVKQSAWFQEGGNVWLQQTADARRSGNYRSMGNLNATDLMAPFMPIECYSGWLLNNTFGGPSAEGVNQYDAAGKQLCHWRRTLGGHQYSSMFPTVLAQIVGDGAIGWIWVNCPGRVLEGLAGGIGETQMRRVITEYRSKMAIMDLGEWTTASINLLNSNFGANIGAEYQPSTSQPPLWKVTPYVMTTRNGNILTPDTLTLPGWSGSNQIPLTVTGNTVTVNFQPIGENMTCQLAYRTTTGKAIYSEYVSKGNCFLKLDAAPASGVVIAIITNTNYIYRGEATRKAKYNYKLGLVTGVTGAASINTKWYESAKLRNLNTVTFTGTILGEGGISPEVSGFLVGDTATLTAYPKAGFKFVGWSGDASGSTTPLKILMNVNKKVTANFTSTITSLDESIEDLIIASVSPNPSSENFNVVLTNPSDIEVITTEGQVVLSFKNISVATFGNELKAGIYLVKTGNSFHKIIKK
ncbi:MAG: T9SS type A sorting domain-containing protein [Opitutaceae bacterium]|nr:T9SS type A sorting domain-containing protein [Cytophagales bacterium]